MSGQIFSYAVVQEKLFPVTICGEDLQREEAKEAPGLAFSKPSKEWYEATHLLAEVSVAGQGAVYCRRAWHHDGSGSRYLSFLNVVRNLR
jgi:hypothetical protein